MPPPLRSESQKLAGFVSSQQRVLGDQSLFEDDAPGQYEDSDGRSLTAISVPSGSFMQMGVDVTWPLLPLHTSATTCRGAGSAGADGGAGGAGGGAGQLHATYPTSSVQHAHPQMLELPHDLVDAALEFL